MDLHESGTKNGIQYMLIATWYFTTPKPKFLDTCRSLSKYDETCIKQPCLDQVKSQYVVFDHKWRWYLNTGGHKGIQVFLTT